MRSSLLLLRCYDNDVLLAGKGYPTVLPFTLDENIKARLLHDSIDPRRYNDEFKDDWWKIYTNEDDSLLLLLVFLLLLVTSCYRFMVLVRAGP
jgi:hypothetical protein